MTQGTSALRMTAVAKPRDLSRFDPRPRVRQAALECPMPRTGVVSGEREESARRAAARPAMRLRLSTVLLFAAALSLLLMIVYSFMTLSMLNTQNGGLSKELAELRKQEGILRKQAENAVDLGAIERRAVEGLGMIKPEAEQIVYVRLVGSDHAEVLEQKDFWDSLSGIFSTVTGSVRSYLE